jgi:hypothetical protein
MTKNPVLNALAALLYIVSISSLMYFGLSNLTGPDTILAPVAMLSLFTFSAAVMGYLFLYQPFQLYFDGKKKQGVDLFLKTMASFGIITAIALALLFFGNRFNR